MKGGRHISLMDFSENSKVYYIQFLRDRLYERYSYVNKSR